MEEYIFKYKSLLEQFKEQYPDLYDEIYYKGYYKGYNDGLFDINKPTNKKDKSWLDLKEDEDISSLSDNTERYCYTVIGNNKAIYECIRLIEVGYTTSQLWENYINNNIDDNHIYFIVYNPIHKEFAINKDINEINTIYPNLANATYYPENKI